MTTHSTPSSAIRSLSDPRPGQGVHTQVRAERPSTARGRPGSWSAGRPGSATHTRHTVLCATALAFVLGWLVPDRAVAQCSPTLVVAPEFPDYLSTRPSTRADWRDRLNVTSKNWGGTWGRGEWNGVSARPYDLLMNALQLLYAAPLDQRTTRIGSYSSMLNWAHEYVLSRVRTVNPSCSSDNLAYTRANRVDLRRRYFGGSATTGGGRIAGVYATTVPGTAVPVLAEYTVDVVNRAAILLHEARHAGGCRHHSDSICENRQSCDRSLADGCSGPRVGVGAAGFHYRWAEQLAHFGYQTEQMIRHRLSAAALANNLADQRFQVHPGRCVVGAVYLQTVGGARLRTLVTRSVPSSDCGTMPTQVIL